MRYFPLNIADTIDMISRRRPVLEGIMRRFQPLLEKRQATVDELVRELKAEGKALPPFAREKSHAGLPLLADPDLSPYMSLLQRAADKMLPALLDFPPLKRHANTLLDFFVKDSAKAQKLFEAFLLGDDASLREAAHKLDMEAGELIFVTEFILSPFLRALVQAGPGQVDAFPWNEEGVWRQGYCPVCGEAPVIAWLDRPRIDDENTFLVGGGGKKNFHCSLCGASWHFQRGICPACGKEGNGVMEILQQSGAHGERIDFCTLCDSYCPTVDLREFGDVPNMDVMALGMLHMDIVASQKKLQPLKPAFWNMF